VGSTKIWAFGGTHHTDSNAPELAALTAKSSLSANIPNFACAFPFTDIRGKCEIKRGSTGKYEGQTDFFSRIC